MTKSIPIHPYDDVEPADDDDRPRFERVDEAPPTTPTASRWSTSDGPRGDDYDERWSRLAKQGFDIHGEADLVSTYHPRTVLDAGCGTGRVAIELARRGCEVTGVDLDEHMLASARRKAPDVQWVLVDLGELALGAADGTTRRFDAVVAAGNVMIYLAPGSERAVISRLVDHLQPGGHLIAGFQLRPEQFTLAAYDDWCAGWGLELDARHSTWDGGPYEPSAGYAVSIHRRLAGD